jgi:uncharacterized GH25 family protein
MKISVASLVLSALLTISFDSHAHRAWLLPSSTVLSGDTPWVSIDAAVSNQIFHADHAPFRLNGLQVVAPSGQHVELQNAMTGKYRSTFDLALNEEGTYKIYSASAGIQVRWLDAEGKRKSWPERGQIADMQAFASAVPKDATDLSISYTSRRIETFVTAGTPSVGVIKPTKVGLELVPITHPNDLYAGETAKFSLLMDGEPAAGAEVEVMAGGMRYRNSQSELLVTTDQNGQFSITWPHAGMYWLSTSYADDKAVLPATKRQGSYSVTFEVLPQ